jgi:hypothetical protein
LAWKWCHRPYLAKRWFLNESLMGEATIQGFVPFIGIEVVPCRTTQDDRNGSRVVGREADRDKQGIVGFGVVEFLRNDRPFPLRIQTFSRFFLASESALIALGTHHQHKVSVFNLVDHPPRPSFRWRDFILIDAAINAIATQAVGKGQYTVSVCLGVMAIAHKDFGALWGRHGIPPRLGPAVAVDVPSIVLGGDYSKPTLEVGSSQRGGTLPLKLAWQSVGVVKGIC